MIQIYNIETARLWDECVKSFAQYDVYYLSGYIRAFQIHGDGDPQLLYYEADGLRAIYVYMKRNTAIEGYYDSITPYGYGGVLFEGDVTDENLHAFWTAFVSKMKEQNIVDNFVRYHPVLSNAVQLKRLSNVIDLGKTVALDLSSPEVIWSNITSKNRNMIRKAEKNGIEIRHGKDLSLFADFKRIYNATMEKDHAEEYYFFGDGFYETIHHELYEHYEMFYAILDGEIIAMSIILFANKQMHYHLSGSLAEYRNLAPSNLLLYKAALWGCEQGYKTFHLGGGVGSGEDNLYKFKAAFNRQSNYQFSIGKEIYDQEKYNELVAERAAIDEKFDRESSFFPVYRQETKPKVIVMKRSVGFRRFEMRDADTIYRYKNDPELNRLTVGTIHSFSRKDAEDWVYHCMVGDREDMKFWAICTNDDEQRCIGWISLVNIDKVNSSAETGAILIGDKDYHDGFAWIESSLYLFEYGFEVLKLNRIYGVCLSDHKLSRLISKALYEKTEGVLRQAIYKNGKYNDLISLGILKNEYFEHKNKGDYQIMKIIKNLIKLKKEDTSPARGVIYNNRQPSNLAA